MKTILMTSLLVVLSGCAGEFFPISDETSQTASGYTKDASVANESEVHKTLRNRDNKYAAAYATSGTHIKFKMQEVSPGVHVQVIDELTIKESPRFDTPLPQVPSIHPLWAAITSVGNNIVDKTFLGFLGSQLFGSINKATENTGTHYNGPYAPVADSYNQTAQPFIVEVPVQ